MLLFISGCRVNISFYLDALGRLCFEKIYTAFSKENAGAAKFTKDIEVAQRV